MDPSYFYLAHVSQNPEEIVKGISSKEEIQWIFLGQDYSRLLLWQKAMPSNSRLIEIKQELDKAVAELSDPFVLQMTSLGRLNDSPAWWASRVSEKNNLVSPLFLHCCYLKICKELFGKIKGPVLIVGEDTDLLISAQNLASAKGCSVRTIGVLSIFKAYFGQYFKMFGRVVKFVFRSFQLWLAQGKSIDRAKDIILIHTYVDEPCLTKEGNFKDRYFPGLAAWLEQQGQYVVTLPVFYNIQRSYADAWNWLRQAQGNFLNPFQYYTLSDYIFALRESFHQQTFRFDHVELQGLDVSCLFKAEQRRHGFGCLDSLLYYRLPVRLIKAGLKISRVIMSFENMIDEKTLNLGLKKYSPQTISIGYQHGALYPTLMCQFVSSDEAVFAPLSDKIVCSGRLFRDILVEKGLPEKKMEIGPALRYTHLSAISMNADQPKAAADILVPLPLMESDAAELLIKVIEAFENKKHLKVLLKAHPMTQARWLSYMKSQIQPLSHFSLVTGSMDDCLKQVKMVIGMSSCALIEVYASGKPVLVIARSTAIDFNPLSFFPDFDNICTMPQEIANKTQEILGNSLQIKTKHIAPIFSSVTDELMEAFLKD